MEQAARRATIATISILALRRCIFGLVVATLLTLVFGSAVLLTVAGGAIIRFATFGVLSVLLLTLSAVFGVLGTVGVVAFRLLRIAGLVLFRLGLTFLLLTAVAFGLALGVFFAFAAFFLSIETCQIAVAENISEVVFSCGFVAALGDEAQRLFAVFVQLDYLENAFGADGY